MEGIHYGAGDIVKVWSFQSFSNSSSLNGELAIVREDQSSKSVLLIVALKPNPKRVNPCFAGCYALDICYEVYQRQIELVQKATKANKKNVKDFLQLNYKIRSHEASKMPDNYEKISWNYAPEFYIDDDFHIQLNRDILQYPEVFI